MKGLWLWVATWLSITTTVLRSLNMGYIPQLYLGSAASYAIMCYFERDRRLLLLNGFYLVTALVAVVRWSD